MSDAVFFRVAALNLRKMADSFDDLAKDTEDPRWPWHRREELIVAFARFTQIRQSMVDVEYQWRNAPEVAGDDLPPPRPDQLPKDEDQESNKRRVDKAMNLFNT